jgi:hypothetical protein
MEAGSAYMKRMSEDEWVTRLRERYATGGQAAVDTDPVYDDLPGEDERPGLRPDVLLDHIR